MKIALQLGWHLIRYTLATAISILISALVPFLIASIPLVLAIVWVLAWGAALVFYLLTGEVIDVEMGEPIGLVLVPLLLTLMGVVTMSAALLLTIAFNLLIILPFSIITEFLYGRWFGKHPLIRPGIFVGAGILLGVIIAVIGTIGIASQQSEMSSLQQVGLAAFLFITCVCTEFAFGLSLTLIDAARKGIEIIRKLIKRRQAGDSLPNPI